MLGRVKVSYVSPRMINNEPQGAVLKIRLERYHLCEDITISQALEGPFCTLNYKYNAEDEEAHQETLVPEGQSFDQTALDHIKDIMGAILPADV